MPSETEYNLWLYKSIEEQFGERAVAHKLSGGEFQQGEPDICGVVDGFAFYIEGKIGKEPIRDSTTFLHGKFTEKQLSYLRRLHRHGVFTMIALYFDRFRSRPAGVLLLSGKEMFTVLDGKAKWGKLKPKFNDLVCFSKAQRFAVKKRFSRLLARYRKEWRCRMRKQKALRC